MGFTLAQAMQMKETRMASPLSWIRVKLVFLQRLLIIRCIICELLGFLVEFSYHYRISKEICIVLLVSITVSDNTLIEVFHLILGFSFRLFRISIRYICSAETIHFHFPSQTVFFTQPRFIPLYISSSFDITYRFLIYCMMQRER